MKYIKTYEKLNEYKIGDYVKIMPNSIYFDRLSHNIGEIVNITYAGKSTYYVLKDIITDKFVGWMNADFIKLTSSELEELKLKIDIRKYNI